MFILAQKLNRYALLLIRFAIVLFLILGTLSSLKYFHDTRIIAQLFEYLPIVMVGCSIPLTLMTSFLLMRLNLCNIKTLMLMIVSAALLFFAGKYYGMAGWISIAFVLKWRIAGFVTFLAEHPDGYAAEKT